jgi:putative endonuclease
LSDKRISLGKQGEAIALQYLSSKGYHIVATNYRTRCGEIDIIAAYREALIFIEVKTRKSRFLDSPLAAVTEKKQRSISIVAQEYLSRNKKFNSDARFDVIAIHIGNFGKKSIEHIENAFDLCYGH